MRLYRGRIRGEESSFAYMAVEPNDMVGSVTFRGVEYSFSTHLDGLPTVGDRVVNIFEATDEMKAFDCGVDDDAIIDDVLRGMPADVTVLSAGMDTRNNFV